MPENPASMLVSGISRSFVTIGIIMAKQIHVLLGAAPEPGSLFSIKAKNYRSV